MGWQQAWTALDAPWRACLEQAWVAYAANTIPVGAALTDGDGQVVAIGRNRVYASDKEGGGSNRLLGHAEMDVLQGLDPERRYEDHVIFGSLEPCLLCVGAAAMATVGTIRYAGIDPYAGAAHSTVSNPHIERLDFSVEGPLEGAFGRLAAALHVEFFLRRNRNGHVVATHSEKAPELVELAREFQRLDLFAESQHSPRLPNVLPRIWPALG